MDHTWRCPVCETESGQLYAAARTELPPGPPDLDTRAFLDKLESGLPHSVWRCPECGFAEAPKIYLQEREPVGDYVAALVRSHAYRAQLEDESLPHLARSWLCRAMVEGAEGRLVRAGWSALCGAWACDDLGDEGPARHCRLRALHLWSGVDEAGEAIVEQGFAASQLLLADVLRRAGRFEEARWRCHRGLSGRPEEPFRSLLEFEIEVVAREDTGAHHVGEALGA